MLQIHSQRKIEFVTVERATAWIVLAIPVEIRGDERIVLDAPKVVKVILKANSGLPGATKSSTVLALPAPKVCEQEVEEAIVSPYYPTTLGFSNSEFVIGLAARPPTVL